MTKFFTHWTFAFVTLFILTYIGLQDPTIKETLRLKSFDFLIQSQEKSLSDDIIIVEIDEKAIEKYGQYPFNRSVYADLIVKLRDAEAGIILFPILFSEEERSSETNIDGNHPTTYTGKPTFGEVATLDWIKTWRAFEIN